MLEEALGVEKVMRMAIDAVIMTIETIIECLSRQSLLEIIVLF